jgi:hypothetical protein
MNEQIVIVSVHNGVVGRVFSVSSYSNALLCIQKMAEEKLSRKLNSYELDILYNDYLVYSDEDEDNVWSISICAIEEF